MLCLSQEGKICLTNASFFLLLGLLGLTPSPLFTTLFRRYARNLFINSNDVPVQEATTSNATGISTKSVGMVNSRRRSQRSGCEELPACPPPTQERKSSVFMR